uniref:C-type lectin domain-containing protein n=1 Tax=Poecilia reticulata TaxID=8081 RepID=A0A3P9NBK4_POERE
MDVFTFSSYFPVANCDKCTPGWAWYDGRCFLFINVTMTWAAAEEGNWLWSDGSKFLFHHWGKNEPNNGKGNEDCMEINFAGIYYWKIATCNFMI